MNPLRISCHFVPKIKTILTLSILTVSLLICLLTLVSCPINIFNHTGKNKTHISSELFESDSKEVVSNEDMFDEFGRYIIDDYDTLPPLSDFLPVSLCRYSVKNYSKLDPIHLNNIAHVASMLQGVAGIFGKPLWSFYVNRGQGIVSFGVKSKRQSDHGVSQCQ
jgi:hypothetical protein